MRGRERNKHPGITRLAMYAGQDLHWWQNMGVRRHLRECEPCDRYVTGLLAAKAELRRQAESQTLTGFEAIADWSRLENEMTGNISVGVAAARCVDTGSPGRRWRAGVLATAGLTLLFVVGWFTHIPPQQNERIAAAFRQWAGFGQASPAGTFMRTLPDGIAVRSQGLTLTMRHPRSAAVTVSGPAAMEARYVDEDTGQVTISSVYGQ